MALYRYPARFIEQRPPGAYLVHFPDFPEARTFGRSLDHAREMAADCLREAIRSRGIDGEDLPPEREIVEGEEVVQVDVP